MTYRGKCVGGPLSGQWLAHTEKRKIFFRPMLRFQMITENSPVVPVVVGEYHLNDFDQWRWWPTEAGKALETLDKLGDQSHG